MRSAIGLPAPAAMPHSVAASWRTKWINLRNRLIADPGFQRWAAAFPLTRFIAQRRARALFDICAGFVYSQTLLACVRLGLFGILNQGPQSLGELANKLSLTQDAAERLLRAAVSLKLVRVLGDRYALADLGASLLGNPSVADFVEHHALLYDDLRDPVSLLRGQTSTKLARFWPYAKEAPGSDPDLQAASGPGDAEAYAAYSRLMASSQALVAQDILDAYPISKHQCLLDVGGGEGAFVAAAAARAPQLAFKLFDLPPVAALARAKIEALGIGAKVEIIPGSFLAGPLPAGADLITLVRIIHDHDDASALTLLRAANAALPPGGTLLLAEPMAGARGAEPIGDAYFGFYLLAMGRGRARTPQELARLLQSAGFTQIKKLSTRRPMLAELIISHRV